MIHPLACVHPSAVIAESAQIGPFAYIEENVVIGERTVVMANASVMSGARIGDDCQIFPSAVVGAIPQDLKFRGEDTLAIIGNNTVIRECATVHRGTASKGKTVVGNNCLIMAYSHVAHDCLLHDHIIMSNATQLAGEVEVDDFAIIGGGTLVHQFSHIGAHVMIQGGSKVNKDIPPYILSAGNHAVYEGINAIGLRRRGFSNAEIETIKSVYKIIYEENNNVSDALRVVDELYSGDPHAKVITDFIRASKRGICKRGGSGE